MGYFPLGHGTYLPQPDSQAIEGRHSEFDPARAASRDTHRFRALPPSPAPEAIPKDVSGRTSYNPARLEFHHEPQLIRCRFNESRFGPPQGFTPASSWPWLDRRVSGLCPRTERPVQARFRSGSASSAYPCART